MGNLKLYGCSICRESKPATRFTIDGRTPRSLMSSCKDCNAEKARARRAEDPEAHRNKQRAYRAANRERINAVRKLADSKNIESIRAKRYKYDGLPEPTRPRPERCELCAKLPNGSGCLHLDHDHFTGKFRGWLCSNCNTAIGKLGDTRHGLAKAMAYLIDAELRV